MVFFRVLWIMGTEIVSLGSPTARDRNPSAICSFSEYCGGGVLESSQLRDGEDSHKLGLLTLNQLCRSLHVLRLHFQVQLGTVASRRRREHLCSVPSRSVWLRLDIPGGGQPF
jgi:hypothetical protein